MKASELWALHSPGGRLIAASPPNVDIVGIDVGPVEVVHIAMGLGRISREVADGLFAALESRVFLFRGYALSRGAYAPAIAPVAMEWLHVATPLDNLQLDAESLAAVHQGTRAHG